MSLMIAGMIYLQSLDQNYTPTLMGYPTTPRTSVKYSTTNFMHGRALDPQPARRNHFMNVHIVRNSRTRLRSTQR